MTRRGGLQPNARAVARLRRWYARAGRGRWSVRELIHAWTLRVPPNVWNVGWRPNEAEMAAYPGRYFIHSDGTAWGPHDLAIARAELATMLAASHGFVRGEIGAGAFVFGPPIDELVRCGWTFAGYRARERNLLARRTDDSADAALSRLVHAIGIESVRLASAHVGLRTGVSARTGRRYRKSVGIARLARALLIWGLIEAGLSHRAAIKRWLAWEIALGGPAADTAVVREAWDLIAAGVDRDAAEPIVTGVDRDVFRDFEESQRGANEQIWVALGIAR